MKSPSALTFLSFTICMLVFGRVARAAVSYWDPEGIVGGYNICTNNSLAGAWENLSWARNPDGSEGPDADEGAAAPSAFTEGDAAVFAVGAGATNAGVSASTMTFTLTMNNNHIIAGVFNASLNDKACKVTIEGPGILTLT